jgi:hypothetical protein
MTVSGWYLIYFSDDLLVRKPINGYTARIIMKLNTKFMRVSLTECDLLSISMKV